MNLGYRVYCVHEELEHNVECVLIGTDVEGITDNAVLCFRCPTCKKEVVTTFDFPTPEKVYGGETT
jgi:hypothetical protein